MCNKKNGKQVEVSFKGCFYNVLCITEKVYILHKRPGQQVEVKGLNEILLYGLVFETKSHWQVTLTMTAGLYNDAPVENEFNHGVREGWWKLCWKKMLCGHFSSKNELIQAAMESLLSEMETAGGSCSGDDCEASYEVTEL